MASLAVASAHAVARGVGNNNRGLKKQRHQNRASAVAPVRCCKSTVDTATTAAVSTPVLPSRRAAFVGAAAAALTTLVAHPGPALAGNAFEDFAEGQLASKGKLFMGPIALAFERLTKLQAGLHSLPGASLVAWTILGVVNCMVFDHTSC